MKKLIILILLALIVSNIGMAVAEDEMKITYLVTEEAIKLMGEKDFEIVGYSNYSYYVVQPGDSLYLLARRHDTSVRFIKHLNKLKSDELIVGQEILLPNVNSDNSNSDNDITDVYTVQSGDTLYLLARKFNTTVNELKRINNLNSNILFIGQKIYLKESAEDEQQNRVIYYVEKEDNLYLLARKFNTTIDTIKRMNDLDSNWLQVGQLLYLPGDVEETRIVYLVKAGDSLYSIANKYNTTVQELRNINDLRSIYVYVGQKIYIPVPQFTDNNYNIVLNYRVEIGDSFTSIAREFDISAMEIRQYNNINYLRPGQYISIPFTIPSYERGYKLEINNEDLGLLARAVHSEARGEVFKGKVAVAAVILNRIYHPFFPDTIKEIIFQPWQFTAVHDGQFWLEPGQTAYVAARAALKGWDPSQGAIFYYNPDTASSSWIYHREVIVKIGEHYFAVKV